jgi:hypothetical protein
MYERPELVNPANIDDYSKMMIAKVSGEYNKNNPFDNGFHKKFGTEWKDKDGYWQTEKRKRW